ncbi:hypothetical protein EYF80_018036 [Liparis tanakae]|uniref:Uncharacterized protein n=1 Tax=Liparis tanakae TaxID=230148 RepID=A0A4Z2I2I9_9TELE|nr:hypothetical protein EYF80_018036 [Liparis tanakae]
MEVDCRVSLSLLAAQSGKNLSDNTDQKKEAIFQTWLHPGERKTTSWFPRLAHPVLTPLPPSPLPPFTPLPLGKHLINSSLLLGDLWRRALRLAVTPLSNTSTMAALIQRRARPQQGIIFVTMTFFQLLKKAGAEKPAKD